MSDLVIALPGETPDSRLYWALFRDGAFLSEGESANVRAFAERAFPDDDDARLMVVLQGDVAASRALPAPPKGRAKFVAAAKLLLEDELAENVDDLHVAVEQGESGEGRIVAVKTSVVALWRDAFVEADAPIDVLTCDYLCLPGRPDRPAAFAVGDRLLAFDGERGFGVEANLGGDLLADLLKTAADRIDALSDDAGDLGASAAAVKVGLYADPGGPNDPADALIRGCEHLGVADNKTLVSLAVERFQSGGLINLLQGDFRPARRSNFQLGVWQRAAMLAGAAIGLSLLVTIADARRTGALAAHYEDEAHRIHGEAFPNANTLDIRRHARNQLASGGAASFIDVARRMEGALEAHDGVSIDRIQFDASRGAFVFSLRSRSNADTDGFRTALEGAGLAVTDTSGYRRQGAVWIGDMSVRLQ